MTTYEQLFENNGNWVKEMTTDKLEYFTEIAKGQTPQYLYIGCSDSRAPIELITNAKLGEFFVHRNIANMVVSTDLNAMSVIDYAVDHLHVKDIIVCGHYNCGGVKAAMTPQDLGLLNPWLRNIRDVFRLHRDELMAIEDEHARYNRLVEINVIEQCTNIIKTATVQKAYKKNGYPVVHGWVMDLESGKLKDLNVDFKKILADIQEIYNLVEDTAEGA